MQITQSQKHNHHHFKHTIAEILVQKRTKRLGKGKLRNVITKTQSTKIRNLQLALCSKTQKPQQNRKKNENQQLQNRLSNPE